MPIIKMVDFPITPPLYLGRLQSLGIQPGRTYREILARDVVVNGVHVAEPYVFDVAGVTAITVAIPHGLSRDANGTVLTGTGRIPDVVTPFRVHYINPADGVSDLSDIEVLGAVSGAAIGLWTSGWCADAKNVYITLVIWGAQSARVRFFVYTEFTHSVIGDEAYTVGTFSDTVYCEALGQV
jgi:hypothetical protein